MSEQNGSTTDAEVMVYPRMDGDEMTKADIAEHLKDVHGVWHINGIALGPKSKITKDEMLSFHERIHERLDEWQANQDDPTYAFYENRGRGRNGEVWKIDNPDEVARGFRPHGVWSVSLPTVLHRHNSITDVTTDEQKAQAAAARNNEPVSDKPLSVQERKVLKELVDNDFNALKSEMRQFAADALTVAKREVEDEWADKVKDAPKYGKKFTELVRKQEAEKAALKQKHEDQRKAVEDEAAAAGVKITGTVYDREQNATVYATEVTGLKAALAKIEAENKAMLDRALMTLERQRLTAQRQVLVSGVSKEAATILDTVPEAKTLMVEAQQKQASITA